LPVVEVLQERVERPHPLLDPARQLAPFARGDDPRDHVEGDQPFFTGILAIDVERDADPAKEPLCFRVLTSQPGGILGVIPLAKIGVGGTDRAVLVEHFVEP